MTGMWQTYNFSDCIVDNSVGRANQINSSEIKKSGKYPVVDQGQDFIAGYSNEEDKLVNTGLPYVIFGDHTRCFKYVDFPFIVGADGTKVISPDTKLFEPKFFYFQLLSFDIPSRGYNRHYKLLKEKYLYKPPLPEQRKIAHVLSAVQRAIEQQDKLIRTTTELKKAQMQKLFSEGLNGEKQKQTEIGLVPESWEVVEVGNVFKFSSGKSRPKNTTKEKTDKNQVPVYGGNGILGYTNEVLISETKLILGRVGEYCGGAYLTECASWISDNALYAKKQYKEVDLIFIKNLFEWMNFNQYSNKMGQPLITQGVINDVKFGLPKLEEQKIMAKYLSIIDQKISCHQNKKQTLTSLFKTLLHELMTGARRVNEIEFERVVKLYDLTEPPISMAAEESVTYGNTKRT